MEKEQKKYGVTNDEIMGYLQEHMVTRGEFTDLKGEVTDLKGEVTDLKGEVTDLKGVIVTKEILTYEIGKLRSHMIDFISKENLNLKADIVTMLKTEDQKVSALIQLLVRKNIISDQEARAVVKLDPFRHRAFV